MGLNQTPSAERLHIGFFGKRNAGKSSVMNAVTGQDLAVVSDVKGTTTDPVYKSMELLPLGPVVMMDTPICSPISFRIKSSENRKGRNTVIVVRVAAITALATS